MKNKAIRYLFFCSLIFFLGGGLYAQDISSSLDTFMTTLYHRGQFNGSVLVAVQGNILYRNAFGKADFSKQKDFTTQTPCYLASLSKQFTAMAIMILYEKGKLGYDDKLSDYFSGFPGYAGKITIRNLLNHTSGIPDYFSLGTEHPGLTNKEVLKALEKIDTLNFNPGDRFEYSNSGYVLLAMIIEKVSGISYGGFLKRYIFTPLEMNNTFVLDQNFDKSKIICHGYTMFYGDYDNDLLTTGDGGIYSTVDDLFKWDKSLYSEKLIKKSILEEAFKPAKLNDGTESNYGFGWGIINQDEKKFVLHAGELNGFNTFILRELVNRYTIIFLTNIAGTQRKPIYDGIYHIITGRPYTYPKYFAARSMYQKLNEGGWNFAYSFYDSLKKNNDTNFIFSERETNNLGYQLLNENKLNDAINVFILNVEDYPKSSNVYESLGEAYMKTGDKEKAIASFQKALEIDPNNQDAIKMMNVLNKN